MSKQRYVKITALSVLIPAMGLEVYWTLKWIAQNDPDAFFGLVACTGTMLLIWHTIFFYRLAPMVDPSGYTLQQETKLYNLYGWLKWLSWPGLGFNTFVLILNIGLALSGGAKTYIFYISGFFTLLFFFAAPLLAAYIKRMQRQ